MRFGFISEPVAEIPVIDDTNKNKQALIESLKPVRGACYEKRFNTSTKDIEYIQQQVADYYGVTTKELLGRSRRTEVVIPRHTSIVLCETLLPHSMQFIAKNHGGRDHATGINAKKVVNDMQFTNHVYRSQVAELKAQLEKDLIIINK
jgi:chromosomal replication initiation ATPase DnaA